MYFLDRNVISELRKARTGKADLCVLQWASGIPSEMPYQSVIRVLEFEMGALSLERRDHYQGRLIRRWLEDQVLPTFEGRILAVDTAVARKCGELNVPDRRAERDAMIAATAFVHRLKVVTRNVTDFDQSMIEIVNPWTGDM
jgi:predicted nucleic acid-binding protein